MTVTTAAVHEEPLPALYRASGTVRGRSTVTITSKTIGYVRAVRVRAGDRVEAGQPLVEIEATDIEAAVARARAELDHAIQLAAEAASGLDAARASEQLTRTTRERMQRLLATGAIAHQQFDEVDSAWRTADAQRAAAEARVRAARSGVEAARAAVAEARATLGYARVNAPFAGRVVERRVDPGTLASPQTPLLVLDDEDALRVEVAVEESRGGAIAAGDQVDVEIGEPPLALVGTVGEIVPAIDVGSRAFVVKVDLPAGTGPLRPGGFARVGFRVGTRPRLVVPSTAISPSGAVDRVFVADGAFARLRMITRGASQGPWTEILSGLDAGELVVVEPGRELVDGSPIEVRR